MSYLQHKEFVIKTDHKSLLHLTEQRIATKIQQKAVFKLMDLQFKIVYKQGAANQAADALSRCHEVGPLCAISSAYHEWLEKIKLGYEDDQEALEFLNNPDTEKPRFKGFTVQDGIIRQHDKIWLGKNALAQHHIIQAIHSSGVGGHSGFLPTYQRIRQLFIWPKMKDTIQAYIQGCSIC